MTISSKIFFSVIQLLQIGLMFTTFTAYSYVFRVIYLSNLPKNISLKSRDHVISHFYDIQLLQNAVKRDQ